MESWLLPPLFKLLASRDRVTLAIINEADDLIEPPTFSTWFIPYRGKF
jgi:hypothetical protein